MSPLSAGVTSSQMCFPRVSGDEPGAVPFLTRIMEFSPRERG